MASLTRAALLALFLPTLPALAGDDGSAEETNTLDRLDQDDLEFQKQKQRGFRIEGLKTEFSFDMEWHEVSNLDFRALDEETDQLILDSDDRTGLAFTGIGMKLQYRVDEKVDFVMGASHRGLWGTDQIGSTNGIGGWVYFTSLYMDYHPNGENGIKVRVGRQPYEIGGIAGTRDFVLADINDMVLVEIPIGDIGTLQVIPIDLVSSSPGGDDVNFMAYVARRGGSEINYRGDNRTTRHGVVFELDKEELPVQAKVYGFFTDVGAGGLTYKGTTGTGADMTYAGTLGNFTDKDWVVNTGLRVQAEFGVVRPYGQLNVSTGIDRKEQVARDVDTNGMSFGGGVVIDTIEDGKGFKGKVAYYEAMGAAYGTDGMQFSHGYVGMKGRHIGGLIANRYLGWHPSSYVSWAGISQDAHEPARKAGTRLIEAQAGMEGLGPFSVRGTFLFMQDTGVTFLDMEQLDTIDPPYGYSRAEFDAERRMGETLGEEIDIEIWYEASSKLDLNLSGGIMLPGNFYGIPVARVAGTQLGSFDPQTPWVLSAGSHLRF